MLPDNANKWGCAKGWCCPPPHTHTHNRFFFTKKCANVYLCNFKMPCRQPIFAVLCFCILELLGWRFIPFFSFDMRVILSQKPFFSLLGCIGWLIPLGFSLVSTAILVISTWICNGAFAKIVNQTPNGWFRAPANFTNWGMFFSPSHHCFALVFFSFISPR